MAIGQPKEHIKHALRVYLVHVSDEPTDYDNEGSLYPFHGNIYHFGLLEEEVEP